VTVHGLKALTHCTNLNVLRLSPKDLTNGQSKVIAEILQSLVHLERLEIRRSVAKVHQTTILKIL